MIDKGQAYREGFKARESGSLASWCPHESPGSLKFPNRNRVRWFDGYYDAKLAQKYGTAHLLIPSHVTIVTPKAADGWT